MTPDSMSEMSSRKWRTHRQREIAKGKGPGSAFWTNGELLRYRATSGFLDDLTQAAASRHSALGFQCRHRVSTSAPCSFLATRSLRVRSMF
jgi:hypothetical protein